ncbi:arginine/serine-rich protein 1 [Meles meles]|uniref:arginine/serine-rich protein 1 n=1 Tax=Meles meles TaxID=9662 RepID=UPI001E69E7B4|nr:arginine/serine-rich protein 1 [Meles meles]
MPRALASGIFDAFAGARPVRVWRSEWEVESELFSRAVSKSLSSSSTSKGGCLLVFSFHFWCGVGGLWWRRVSGQGFPETDRSLQSRAEMSQYVNDLWPGSPQHKESPSTSRSGRSSRLSSASRSRSSSGSSRSRSSGSSRASSRIRNRSWRRRSRSRSWSGRRHQRKYRRYSRSYSRSRSRSRGRRYRDRRYGPSRRYGRSPSRPRSRSRSSSRGRLYYRRAYALPRGRKYYRTLYPEERGSWRGGSRGRSRTRSRSPTPFRLSEKDRMELLEIAKANAAKALGTTNFDLPASLRKVLASKESNCGTAVPNSDAKFELSGKLGEDGTKNPTEKPSQQKSIAFSSNNSVAKPMLQKSAKATAEETSSGSPKIDKKKSPYALWLPV